MSALQTIKLQLSQDQRNIIYIQEPIIRYSHAGRKLSVKLK
jgi:hypothetical protein